MKNKTKEYYDSLEKYFDAVEKNTVSFDNLTDALDHFKKIQNELKADYHEQAENTYNSNKHETGRTWTTRSKGQK